VRDMSLTIEL